MDLFYHDFDIPEVFHFPEDIFQIVFIPFLVSARPPVEQQLLQSRNC
jgi:hypothetical protein